MWYGGEWVLGIVLTISLIVMMSLSPRARRFVGWLVLALIKYSKSRGRKK